MAVFYEFSILSPVFILSLVFKDSMVLCLGIRQMLKSYGVKIHMNQEARSVILRQTLFF